MKMNQVSKIFTLSIFIFSFSAFAGVEVPAVAGTSSDSASSAASTSQQDPNEEIVIPPPYKGNSVES